MRAPFSFVRSFVVAYIFFLTSDTAEPSLITLLCCCFAMFMIINEWERIQRIQQTKRNALPTSCFYFAPLLGYWFACWIYSIIRSDISRHIVVQSIGTIRGLPAEQKVASNHRNERSSENGGKYLINECSDAASAEWLCIGSSNRCHEKRESYTVFLRFTTFKAANSFTIPRASCGLLKPISQFHYNFSYRCYCCAAADKPKAKHCLVAMATNEKTCVCLRGERDGGSELQLHRTGKMIAIHCMRPTRNLLILKCTIFSFRLWSKPSEPRKSP